MRKVGPTGGHAPAVALMEAVLPQLRSDGWKCLSVGTDRLAAGPDGAQRRGVSARLLLTRVSRTRMPEPLNKVRPLS